MRKAKNTGSLPAQRWQWNWAQRKLWQLLLELGYHCVVVRGIVGGARKILIDTIR